jgi:hypothetical protein
MALMQPETENAGSHPPDGASPLPLGVFQPEISSFRLALAAEAKAAKTVRMYTEAVQWFAAAHLRPHHERQPITAPGPGLRSCRLIWPSFRGEPMRLT